MYDGKKIVFMFSGQGSQFLEMGENLYNTNLRIKYYMDYLDNIFFLNTNISFVDEMYNKKNSHLLFNDVGFGCAVLFAIQYSLAKVLMENGVEPDVLVGTSLGEFVALTVSGVLEPEAAIMYVYKVTSYIQTRVAPSGMLTVIGNINKDYINDSYANRYGCIGAFNYDNHFIVSGLTEELKKLNKYYEEQKYLTVLLPTKVGFHNPSLIQPYKESCCKFLEQLKINKPTIEVISTMTAKKVDYINGEYLFNILSEPIKFSDTIKYIEKAAVPTTLMDLGPMATLAGFSKRIIKSDLISTYAFMNLAGDNLESFLSDKIN